MKFRSNDNSPGPSSSSPNTQSSDDHLSHFTNTIVTRSVARLHSQNAGAKRSNHALGKIVKPIAVRAVSSASSTHSSSFASTNHSSQSSSLLSLIRQGSNELKSSANDAGFSIIAKYFASFPATRLKSTPSCADPQPGPFDHFKATPFLPFKKTNATNSSTCSLQCHSAHCEPTSNTDHLCTNFKRLIKLSQDDEHTLTPASPLTARSSNTPNSLLNDQDSNDSDQLDSRLGQMTMETRSTRKFLIKHHPYLRYNSQLMNSVSPSQARPSINLLKMKKLKRDDSPLLYDSGQVDSAALNTRRRSKLRKHGRKEEELMMDADESTDVYELTSGQELISASLNSSKELDDCKEEDSSGYYSSYQSVDLVSTSGGSCVGESLPKRSSDRSSEKVKQEQPHHHYQTRYFTNYLQSLPSEQKPSAARPVTRLRYQQQQQQHQQVASNNSNGQSCDLDLDLIEND